MTPPRRDYGSGSVYKRKDGRWCATIEAGWTASGTRKRVVLTAKTEAQVKRKLRDRLLAMERGEVGTSPRETVKGWAEKYFAIRVRELSPKAYNAAASPIKTVIVPTIGHRRLEQLSAADVRAVHDARRKKDRQPGDAHRVLLTMLNRAVEEGYQVPPQALAVKAPKAPKSDRQAMTIEQGLVCLEVASSMPNGSRWLFTLVYGQRMGECLGLTWDAVDLEPGDGAPFGEAVIEWQLQALPYEHGCDEACGKRAASCPARRFRIPDGYEAKRLVDSYHLVRPKSRAGYRVAPLLEPVRDALVKWREDGPASPHDLVWPEPNGRPRNDKHDRSEWWALQAAAGVHHPTRLWKDKATGRMVPAPYHVHECRNFAATMLLESGVPEHVVTDLLGHSTVATSLRYRTRRREPLLDAMTKVGERLQLGTPPTHT